MKSKFKYLIEAGIVSAPSAFGAKPTSNKPVNTQSGAWGGDSASVNSVNTVQPGERPNPFTVTPTPTPAAPVQPKFNPVQPFGPVIPTVPSVQPGTEYTPTPGSVKPKNPTVVQVPPAPATPGATPTPAPAPAPNKTDTSTSISNKTDQRRAAMAKKEHEAVLARQARIAEKEAAKTAALNAEAERRQAENAVERAKPWNRSSRSGRNVFEQYKLQFKRDALKSLLDLQEAGIADTVSAGWDWAKENIPAGWDWAQENIPYLKTATDKVKGVASDAWKYTSDPAYAAKTMIKYTTPTPGEPEPVRFAKTLVGYSPDTIARMQARRGAAASAFDTATANEKLRHYEKMFAASNPASVLSKFAGAAGGAWQASLADKAAEAARNGVKVKTPGFIENLATSLAGAGASTGQDIINAQVAAQAKEAARQKFAREDDWRVLTR